MKQKMLSRAPTVLLIITPFCRRISVLLYTKGHYFPHVYSNRIWRADSLRQYLECNFIFGYTSRLLLDFLLHCSLANQFFLDLLFTYCSLEYRRIQIYCFISSFLISNFSFLITHFSFLIFHFAEPRAAFCEQAGH